MHTFLYLFVFKLFQIASFLSWRLLLGPPGVWQGVVLVVVKPAPRYDLAGGSSPLASLVLSSFLRYFGGFGSVVSVCLFSCVLSLASARP